jgi:hypothetical protein
MSKLKTSTVTPKERVGAGRLGPRRNRLPRSTKPTTLRRLAAGLTRPQVRRRQWWKQRFRSGTAAPSQPRGPPWSDRFRCSSRVGTAVLAAASTKLEHVTSATTPFQLYSNSSLWRSERNSASPDASYIFGTTAFPAIKKREDFAVRLRQTCMKTAVTMQLLLFGAHECARLRGAT